MRVVIQRVNKAKVVVNDKEISKIEKGFLILLGIEKGDEQEDIEYLIKKTSLLRVFDDEKGIMNKSIKDVNGEILVISQFTLLASTRHGNRPSWIRAAGREEAIPLYESFCQQIVIETGKEIKQGVFGADMQVSLTNDGPVTVIIDSKNKE